MRPKVILLADGAKKDLGKDRVLTEFDGEPLLVRTIRQFGKWASVIVVTTDPQVSRTALDNLAWVGEPDPKSDQLGKLANVHKGLDRSKGQGRTIILFGDVYYSDEAVDIIKNTEVSDWTIYGRSTDNAITGTPWGEIFGFEVADGMSRIRGRVAIGRVLTKTDFGREWRASVWEWYFEMEGLPYVIPDPTAVKVGEHWTEINDITDDVDFPEDIANLRNAVGNK